MKTESVFFQSQERQNLLGQVDLQEEMKDIFKYTSGVIPIEKMSWLQYHYDHQMLQIVTQASAMGCDKTNFIYEFPAELMDLLCSRDTPETYIVNQPKKDPLGKNIWKRTQVSNYSCLFINFHNDTGVYGSLMITVDGKDKYTEAHSRLLTGLKTRLQTVLDTIIKDNEKKIRPPSWKEQVEDENEFFRQTTLRLCGHLDLKVGVYQCLQYLSRFMPAEGLFVRKLEHDLHSERILAESWGSFHQQSDSLIPWETEQRNAADRRELPDTLIINQPEDYSSTKQYIPIYGKNYSSISMPLIHNMQQVGIAVLVMEGRNHYTEEHKLLFSKLHDLFVLAVSNEIKHREVIRLKNLIEEEKKDLQEELEHARGNTIIGASLGLKGVMEHAHLVAEQESPVLLSGETGVGKEIIANFIHQNSSRKHGPLIKVNCGGIPDTLVDSELFGHEKGAFTGAVSRKMGRFERANGGTIFLDEIGELPPQAQVRLLRVLQNKIIERVGGTDNIPVDIRIIAATHRNLEEMVASGQFREDLWFRLNVFPIRIPPLRSRRSDIPALADYFIEKKSSELNLQKPSLSSGAMEKLTAYGWPGNVRELENVIERELILSEGKPLMFQSLISEQLNNDPLSSNEINNEVLSLDEANVRHIKKVLEITNGKVSGPGGAAELLKIHPSTLRKRMDKLGIPYSWKKGKND